MLDLTAPALDSRIQALATMWAGASQAQRERNVAYLRAMSPEFNSRIGEHDQWTDDIRPSDAGRFRSSFNVTRAVVELWTSLEASEFPAIRWQEGFLPTPVNFNDPQVDAQREAGWKIRKGMARQLSTMRESVLMETLRQSKLPRAFYRWVERKNTFGLAWLKCIPDDRRQRFVLNTGIDPSTVYPVWSGWEDGVLDAVLVAYRKSVQSALEQFPDADLKLDKDGISIAADNYYRPTTLATTDAERNYVWIEDYWVVDRSGEQPRVVNAIRVNGSLPRRPAGDAWEYTTITEYPGWTAVPYFFLSNDNLRDHTGFSDAGLMLPFQDAFNRFMSEQADVISGESRPKFKFRGDSDRTIEIGDEQVVSLDPDEDIEQIGVTLNVFPTQVHGTQLMDLLSRSSGLPDVVWGRIVASQNSGRALATAWRAVAARLVPRVQDDGEALERLLSYMVDIMELKDWSAAKRLYAGNRDFELDFPNQEPRDFTEVVTAALNKLNAGTIDLAGAMEEMGEKAPDEMIERVRNDYQDAVLHPEKRQSQLFLERMEIENATAIQNQQLQAAQAVQSMQVEKQAAAVNQANTQAQQQAAPTLTQGQNAPATQAGAPANAAVKSTTMVQGGQAQNRSIIPV